MQGKNGCFESTYTKSMLCSYAIERLFSLFIAPPISGDNENIFSQGRITQVASYLPNDKDASIVYMKPPMFHNSSYLSTCNC